MWRRLCVLGVDRFLKTQAGLAFRRREKEAEHRGALSGREDILILDEPGAALDLEAKEADPDLYQELCESRGDSSFNIP